MLGLGRMAGLASEERLRPGLESPKSEAEVAPPSSSSAAPASESLLAPSSSSTLESGERVSPTLPALPKLSSEWSASSAPSMYRMHFFFLLRIDTIPPKQKGKDKTKKRETFKTKLLTNVSKMNKFKLSTNQKIRPRKTENRNIPLISSE